MQATVWIQSITKNTVCQWKIFIILWNEIEKQVPYAIFMAITQHRVLDDADSAIDYLCHSIYF